MPPYLRLMRPHQWVKNIFIFAPLFFSKQYMMVDAWISILYALLAFICISSCIYVFNDISDVEEDRAHPRKKKRPIAAGDVPVFGAVLLGVLLLCGAFFVAAKMLPIGCVYVIAIYMVMQIIYTGGAKKLAIIDVIIIALGFVLRVNMGAYAIGVEVSPWIIMTTFLLTLFLGFGKRYHELSVVGYDASRTSLQRYSEQLLSQLVLISCVCAVICYAIYTVEMARELGRVELVYTNIFVMYGLFRYLQVLHIDGEGGSPSRDIFTNPVFILNGLMWLGVTLWILA